MAGWGKLRRLTNGFVSGEYPRDRGSFSRLVWDRPLTSPFILEIVHAPSTLFLCSQAD